VLNGGRALVTLDLRLHVMRWTRFLYSSANSLPAAVEIDLKGIPAHAWDYKTAQLLLSDHCSISGADSNPSMRIAVMSSGWRRGAPTLARSRRRWFWRSLSPRRRQVILLRRGEPYPTRHDFCLALRAAVELRGFASPSSGR